MYVYIIYILYVRTAVYDDDGFSSKLEWCWNSTSMRSVGSQESRRYKKHLAKSFSEDVHVISFGTIGTPSGLPSNRAWEIGL